MAKEIKQCDGCYNCGGGDVKCFNSDCSCHYLPSTRKEFNPCGIQEKNVLKESRKIVEDYLAWAEKEYADFTERGLTMLGYDFHSRIVACKHILDNFDKKSKDYEKLYE